MKSKFGIVITNILALLVGITIGGYLFSDTQPRSFLAFNRCENCLNPKELLGLMASVGVQKTPGLIPSVILETDKTIVMQIPIKTEKYHFVIIPKKDIKDVGQLSKGDEPYLIDAYSVTAELIRQKHLKRYRMSTNGPGKQVVAYLHFHLTGSQS